MKSYGATIQMKPFQQFFHMVPFVLDVYIAQTFQSVDEILWCDYSNKTSIFSSRKDGWDSSIIELELGWVKNWF